MINEFNLEDFIKNYEKEFSEEDEIIINNFISSMEKVLKKFEDEEGIKLRLLSFKALKTLYIVHGKTEFLKSFVGDYEIMMKQYKLMKSGIEPGEAYQQATLCPYELNLEF